MLLGGGRWSSGPAVNDNMGGMLHIVHPGEMIVPADVMGGLPSSQGGMYDQIGTESRGFQSVAMVPVQKGLGKGWMMLLLGLAGIAGIAGLSALFSDDDKKKQQDAADKVAQQNSDLQKSLASNIPVGSDDVGTQLSPTPISSSGAPSSTSGSDPNKSLLSSVSGLSNNVSTLSKDMGNLSSATTGATSQMSPFANGLNMLKTVTSTLSSVLSIPKTIGSVFSGIGSLFSGGMGLLGLFGLQGGGIIPSAAGGMITPRFQSGGILSMLHANEMVLPAHISQMIQNAANNNSGGGDTHVVNFHVNTIDSRTGAQFLMNNADTIARAYARSFRSYSGNVPRG